jgi:tRNA-specific adenosine deaminase 2
MHAEFIAINSILSSVSPSSLPNSENLEVGNGLQTLSLAERLQVLKESSLYVTVEPCIMCASLLRQFGIKEVYFGAGNEKFGGNGGVLDIHLGNGMFTETDREEKKRGRRKGRGDYGVSGGWLREEAILMLRRFYVQENGRGEFFPLLFFLYWVRMGD